MRKEVPLAVNEEEDDDDETKRIIPLASKQESEILGKFEDFEDQQIAKAIIGTLQSSPEVTLLNIQHSTDPKYKILQLYYNVHGTQFEDVFRQIIATWDHNNHN